MTTASLKQPYRKLIFLLIGCIGSLIVRFLVSTLRVRVEGDEKMREFRRRGQKVIYTFWHGQMLILTYTHRYQDIHILISDHRDGEIIAQVTRRLGFSSVRGSTTHGSVKAVLNILTKLNNRYDIAITPDGPLGPRWKVQQGVIYIAQKTGLPIIPVASGTNRFWELETWDCFRVPKPFSSALLLYGDPVFVPDDAGKEGIQIKIAELEEKLVCLSRDLEEKLERIR